MSVELEFWHLVTLLLSFFGAVAAFGKVLLDQVEKRLAERFKSQDEARESGAMLLRQTLQQHIDQEKMTGQQIQNLEREFLQWKAEMPVQYVRREDYVRGQSVIEAKLDALYSKLEVLQMKESHHG